MTGQPAGVSDEQRERWGRLSEQATPGPWEVGNANDYPYSPFWTVTNDEYHNPTEEDAPCISVQLECGVKEDAEFIAEARVAVPALLEENGYLEDEIRSRASAWQKLNDKHNALQEETEQLRAQVAALTAQLTEATKPGQVVSGARRDDSDNLFTQYANRRRSDER